MVGGSKAQRETLALGRQLVEELGLEPSVDTLGRWMAHHVAELITRAEAARTTAERHAARDEAVDVILRIWSHRSTAERVNPLADLKPAVSVLQALAQDEAPWMFERLESSQVARRTYDLLRRLTICLCLLESGGIEPLRRGLARAQRTGAHQSRHERAIVAFLASWLSTMPEPSTRKRPRETRGTTTMSKPKGDLHDLRKTTLDIAERAKSSLGELTEQLAKGGLRQASAGFPGIAAVTPVLPRGRRAKKARRASS